MEEQFAASLALIGCFCHEMQCVSTLVKAKYCDPWHILVEKGYVPRGLHVRISAFS
jgi:hypothetical protein